MSQEHDVNNCFDAAFLRVRGEHPNSAQKMGDDLSMSSQNVQDILLRTSTCLSAKGYVFPADPTKGGQDFVNKCLSETILNVMQDINNNTQAKPGSPLAGAVAKKKKPS
jgi:hypothetical protein